MTTKAPPRVTEEGASILKDPQSAEKLMSQRTLQWVATQTPATSIGLALQRIPLSDRLQKGIPIVKITSRGQRQTRILTIAQDRFAIFCTHQYLRKKGLVSTMAHQLPVPLVTRKGVRGFWRKEALRDKYVRYIDVADLEAVQTGVIGSQRLEKARGNRLQGVDRALDQEADQIVTLVHHGNQTLDFLLPDAAVRKELVQVLQAMQAVYHQAKKSVSNEALLLRYIWYDIDMNRDGKVSEAEFAKILNRINLHVKNPGKIFREFVAQDKANRGKGLTYPNVMELLQEIKRSRGLSMATLLWNEIFGEKANQVDAQTFLDKFLKARQGQTDATLADAQEIISAVNGMELNHSKGSLTKDSMDRAHFETYLFDLMNSAYNPWALDGDLDVALDKPMSHYWINTSHNTYLTGDQLQSASSVEMYMRALRRGCKCLELDCWDGEKSGNKFFPVVFHGHTLTSKILFKDIIRGVKSYVQGHPDTYPIILSLENHCSHPFQKAMAADMETILGDLLYVPGAGDVDKSLPSPESLRGKVVIKGKRPPDTNDEDIDATEGDDDDQFDGTLDTPTNAAKATKGSKGSKGAKAVKPPKIVKELARLTLFHGTKFKSFEKSMTEPSSHMHSISEPKITKIISKQASNTLLWKSYNTEHMTRTYPSGARVDSSNYNPMVAWSTGCQLVALNFQTCDTPLVLNDGLFRRNHICGYLLKPPSAFGKVDPAPQPVVRAAPASPPAKDTLDLVMESLEDVICGDEATTRDLQRMERAPQHTTNIPLVKDRSAAHLIMPRADQKQTLSIRVLSGSCLPKPSGDKAGEQIDPYVTVSVHDVALDEEGRASYKSSAHSTKAVNDNGFCPVWNEKTAPSVSISSPEIAMIQFSLFESDVALDDRVAESAIPFSCLRPGLRSIQLFDTNNTRTGAFGMATILVDITISTE